MNRTLFEQETENINQMFIQGIHQAFEISRLLHEIYEHRPERFEDEYLKEIFQESINELKKSVQGIQNHAEEMFEKCDKAINEREQRTSQEKEVEQGPFQDYPEDYNMYVDNRDIEYEPDYDQLNREYMEMMNEIQAPEVDFYEIKKEFEIQFDKITISDDFQSMNDTEKLEELKRSAVEFTKFSQMAENLFEYQGNVLIEQVKSGEYTMDEAYEIQGFLKGLSELYEKEAVAGKLFEQMEALNGYTIEEKDKEYHNRTPEHQKEIHQEHRQERKEPALDDIAQSLDELKERKELFIERDIER